MTLKHLRRPRGASSIWADVTSPRVDARLAQRGASQQSHRDEHVHRNKIVKLVHQSYYLARVSDFTYQLSSMAQSPLRHGAFAEKIVWSKKRC